MCPFHAKWSWSGMAVMEGAAEQKAPPPPKLFLYTTADDESAGDDLRNDEKWGSRVLPRSLNRPDSPTKLYTRGCYPSSHRLGGKSSRGRKLTLGVSLVSARFLSSDRAKCTYDWAFTALEWQQQRCGPARFTSSCFHCTHCTRRSICCAFNWPKWPIFQLGLHGFLQPNVSNGILRM